MILFCANPLFTAIGAWIFFGEKAGPRHALAILLCFAGIYCLLSEEAAIHSLEGDLLGIACSILFSAYVLMSKGLRRHVQNVPFALVTYSFVTLYFFGAVIALDLPFVGYSEKTWASFVALAFGSTLLGHSLFTQCLQYFPVNFLSIATMVEPALTAVSGYFLFGEAVTKAGMVGFVLVALGILSLFIPWLKPSSRAVEKP